MTVTRSRSPSLSGLPGRFPDEPEFKIARKAVGSGARTPTPTPVTPEDMKRQQKAGQQMRQQVLQTMGMPTGNSPAAKNGGTPSAVLSSIAGVPQRGLGNPGNRKPVQITQPTSDEVIPKKNWALEPKQYEALQKNPNDVQALFHIAFYGAGPQALSPVLNPQERVPMRASSALSAKTYPPRTAPAPPFLPNNGHPLPLRNARSWQAPPQAGPYAHGMVDSAPAQSSAPPPHPPKGPPPLPPKELPSSSTGESPKLNVPPALPPR